MANNPVVNSLTFVGSVAGQASIQAQGIAGTLTLLLPNIPPTQGQLLTASSINGNNVFLGWSAAQSLTNIPLSALAQSGATTNQIISWNGTAWVPTSSIPGEGTVTTFSAGTLAPLFTTSVATATSTPALSFILTNAAQNAVFAGPATGGTGAPSYRALVAADIPSLAYLPTSTQLPVTIAAVASNFLTSYTSSTGVFTAAQPDFTDLTGAATIAQINSKQGNGSAVQLYALNHTVTAGDVVVFDAGGNVGDSGTALASLAPLTTPQFVGIVTAATIAAPSGSNLNFTTAGAHEVAITTASGLFEFEGMDGGMSLATQNASIAIDAVGNITIAPASTKTTSINGVAYSSTAPSAAGQIIVSTSTSAAAWTAGSGNGATFATAGSNLHGATAGDLLSSDGAGNVQDSGTSVNNVGILTGQTGTSAAFPDNHTASGTTTINGITPVTVTLTGNAVFSDPTKYVVQVAYQGAIGGAHTGILSVTNSSASVFTIVSTDTTDTTSTIAWTAVGLA